MNEWGEFLEEKQKYKKKVCPHCGKALEAWFKENLWEEYLICENCKYAESQSR